MGLNRRHARRAARTFKRSPRSLRPGLFIAIDQHHSIHRTRGGARDTVDPQPWFLEKPIEHAPRKGAVRAATLQREIDRNGLTAEFAEGSEGEVSITPSWIAAGAGP